MSYRGRASYNRAPNCASRNTKPYIVTFPCRTVCAAAGAADSKTRSNVAPNILGSDTALAVIINLVVNYCFTSLYKFAKDSYKIAIIHIFARKSAKNKEATCSVTSLIRVGALLLCRCLSWSFSRSLHWSLSRSSLCLLGTTATG